MTACAPATQLRHPLLATRALRTCSTSHVCRSNSSSRRAAICARLAENAATTGARAKSIGCQVELSGATAKGAGGTRLLCEGEALALQSLGCGGMLLQTGLPQPIRGLKTRAHDGKLHSSKIHMILRSALTCDGTSRMATGLLCAHQAMRRSRAGRGSAPNWYSSCTPSHSACQSFSPNRGLSSRVVA